MNHSHAATQVIRYWKSCLDWGIFLPWDSQIQLQGYSDGNWIGYLDSKCYISCQCFFLGKSLILWRTNYQLNTSRSSSEVKYKSLDVATREHQWLLYLFKDLRVECHVVMENITTSMMKTIASTIFQHFAIQINDARYLPNPNL